MVRKAALVLVTLSVAIYPIAEASSDAQWNEAAWSGALPAPAIDAAVARTQAMEFANRRGTIGTASHTAALRFAYGELARSLLPGTSMDVARSTAVLTAPSASLDAEIAPSLIDGDPRTSAALLKLLPVEQYGDVGLRVTDPLALPDAFREAVAVFSPRVPALCSGVLVGDVTVLTAAHCACKGVSDLVAFGYDAGESRWMRKVVQVRVPQGVRCEGADTTPEVAIGSRKGRDVAVLTLNLPPVPGWKASPAEFASDAERGSATLDRGVVVVGYGYTRPAPTGRRGTRNGTLVPVISGDCRDQRDGAYECVPGRELVALSSTRGASGDAPDACPGDSGGPAYVISPNRRFRLIALVSRGVNPNAVCGDGTIYTLVSRSLVDDLMLHGTVLAGPPIATSRPSQ